jgi:hypothetical protein
MALILKDRVKESSSSSGTGSITLGGAFPGYQTFNAAIASGSTVYYTIHNLAAGFDTEWEVGVGTFTSPATLARNTVLSSSTGSLINFTAGANGLEVFITQPAEEAVYLNNATGLVEIGGNGTNTVSFTNINASNVVMVSGTISTNAANATDITNKQYVDGLVLSGTHFHEPVLVEEDVSLDAVYVQPNGASNGVGATLTNNVANVALVVDGVSVSNTARILVYAQANAVQNGVYTVTNPGAPDSPGPGAKWVLTRSTDTDTFGLASSTELSEGSTFFVTSGNTGAGRTYTCNTQGTITFGSTNITFAQISSAQIYAAGTGLNLSNLTFSIANTTVVSGLYGDSANVSVIEVNAQGQLTSASNSAINVSNITVGTLANDRTTASASNGASTIVARDANGSFTANVITATDVNSTNVTATTGSFTNVSGNGVALTAINASNVTSGTLDNARTTGNTANSASTIVLRDANGSFGANIISGAFSGDGSAINAINASNISSGTIANARTSAASANGASTIVLRDGSGGFGAGDITANSISGNGVALSAINASNIASGTIANARTTAASANGASTIVLRGASGEFAAGDIVGASANIAGNTYLAVSSGNVGIGTVSPNDTLEVAGANAFIRVNRTGAEPGISFRYSNSGTNRGDIAVTSAGAMYFTAGGSTERMRIDSSGNVGIGTASPAANRKLTISNTGQVAAMRIDAPTGYDSFIEFTENSSVTANTYWQINKTTSTHALQFWNGSERMRIDSTGAVGIGTASPANNSISIARGAGISASVEICANGATPGSTNSYTLLQGTAGDAYVYNRASQPLIFGTSNAERMRISAAGGLGVGTTSDPGAGAIYATGNITAFFSDERLKTKTGDIKNALDKVCQIETLLYHANETAVALGYDASIQEVGVTAQSVQKVQPEIVVPAPIDNKYLTVRYEKLVPLLIEAIKELKAEVDALKGK